MNSQFRQGKKMSASNSAPNQAEVVEHPPRPTRALMLSYGSSMALECYMEKDRASLLSVTRSIMGYGNANVIFCPGAGYVDRYST